MHLSCLEKIVRKRKTRRGKKKNRKFLTSRDRTHNEQQLTKSVNIDGKHDQNNAGDVGRCSDHSHSQYGIKKSENHNSNAVQSCAAREKEVIPGSNEIPNSNTHHDLKRETKPDYRNTEELLVLVRKENGEGYLFLYFLPAS